MTPAPSDEYQTRLAARRATVAVRDRQDLSISRLRLATFGVAVVIGVLAWRGVAHVGFLAVPGVLFAILVKRHERVLRARDLAQRAVDFYTRGLARIDDRWMGGGETGERFRDDAHLYANDVDLFGRGSLFELLSVARTQSGEETLAAWLKAPADRATILARQDAVRELAPKLDLREALALAGAGVRAGVHTQQLVAWAERPSPLTTPATRGVAWALTALALMTAMLVPSGTYQPFVAVFIAQGLFRARQRSQVDEVLHSTTGYVRELSTLKEALLRLEHERFEASLLSACHGRLEVPGSTASRVIQRLEKLIEAHDWEHNIIFTPIAAILMWSSHIAWAVEDWRRQHGTQVRVWLEVVGELEALSSLATYHYEHPADPFPEVVDAASPAAVAASPFVDGTALGHPLLPDARMVRNDVRLGTETRLLIISGSNMSGKSTLLRTLGINAVLAFAGAPVRAHTLRLTPFALGATLRIQDSLVEGRSRFYAEITRVRAIVDVARHGPLLFLLDEIFHGTNSHDRMIGAGGVLRNLLALGAIGLITTHDLALTAIAGPLGTRAQNVHFEDRFEAGTMQFDYRMKPGPVTRSNALALMRAVGLDVEDPTYGDSHE